jgi:hypothetical protein
MYMKACDWHRHMQDGKLSQRALAGGQKLLTFTSNLGPVGSAMDPCTKVKCPVIDPLLPRWRFVQL